MKNIVALLLVAVGSLMAHPVEAVQVQGMPSCGKWIQFHHDYAKGWLLGYLSGVASGLEKDFLRGNDAASFFLWMDKYCREHPLNDLEQGAGALALELINKGRAK